ncbi:MAG: DUF819 family protein [Oscillospiraceae bacterium]|nr:DUF819 family protein [Oscillospiraceae bacterium]
MATLISADNTWVLFGIIVIIAAVAIYLEQTYKWAAKLSGCVIALVLAMLAANLQLIPTDAPAYDFVWSYVVPVAIPMLLFRANVRKIWKESGRMVIIYLISGIGTVVGGFIAFFIFRNHIEGLSAITAMMTGSYTGGSMNLVAMSDAFSVSGETVSASVVADNLLMALYFFVLVAIPGMKLFLGLFRHPLIDGQRLVSKEEKSGNNAAGYWKAKKVSLMDIAKVFAVSMAIVAVSSTLADFLGALIPDTNFFFALLGGLLGNKYLLITTITVLLASLLPKQMESIGGAEEIGTFFIHIFFAVIGVPASVYMIISKAPLLLLFCAVMVLCNMLFSFGFGKLLGFNLEEICVASNANIGGPTTAAAYAIAKGWHALIVPSLLVGTLGYVIGNYYGIFIGTLLGR